ncbi:hypothetical protein NDU88_001557 [Pleurodeles waltl]|uniref:Uncharacterized protein n=1 Tax=Pleurodeles waltl TaxID=8319 RepID=A0AAV7LLV2_PLEWA|nr:hypothetical protein NDU88_001557 [Pleurodeles waltl]
MRIVSLLGPLSTQERKWRLQYDEENKKACNVMVKKYHQEIRKAKLTDSADKISQATHPAKEIYAIVNSFLKLDVAGKGLPPSEEQYEQLANHFLGKVRQIYDSPAMIPDSLITSNGSTIVRKPAAEFSSFLLGLSESDALGE